VQIKKFLAAVEAGDAAPMQTEYNVAAKRLDRAAARRVIHPNTAARKKSQLARMMKKPAAPTA
jgi:small subunit ribosomal protein S20